MEFSRVYISYHNKLCAEGLKSIIGGDPHFKVVKMGANGYNLLQNLAEVNPDIFVVETNWPCDSTLSYLEKVRDMFPEIKRVLITNEFDNHLINDLVPVLNGYLFKNCEKEELRYGLHQVLTGRDFYASNVTNIILKHLDHRGEKEDVDLTLRERQILSMLTKMWSNQEIADSLIISEATVKTHRQNIMRKFGVRNLLGVIRYACRNNMLYDDEGFCKDCPHNITVAQEII